MQDEQVENQPDTEVVEAETAETGDQQQVAEQPQQRMVPLEALEAERHKRQELEAYNKALLEIHGKKSEPEQSDDSDDDEFITKAELKRRLSTMGHDQRREIMEEAFCTSNPQAVELINRNLEEIVKKRPWLAQVIEAAPNRYARAYEIVQDYTRDTKDSASARKFADPKADAKRVVENSKKPGNPSTIAKNANPSNADYLRSIGGTKEFREYRNKMLGRG